MPAAVLDRLELSINRAPRSYLSVFAYNALYFRTALEVMLIPGEWQELRSPRDVLAEAIVDAAAPAEAAATD
jgi:hypothetical protein